MPNRPDQNKGCIVLIDYSDILVKNKDYKLEINKYLGGMLVSFFVDSELNENVDNETEWIENPELLDRVCLEIYAITNRILPGYKSYCADTVFSKNDVVLINNTTVSLNVTDDIFTLLAEEAVF